jgi:hypothetical protein
VDIVPTSPLSELVTAVLTKTPYVAAAKHALNANAIIAIIKKTRAVAALSAILNSPQKFIFII